MTTGRRTSELVLLGVAVAAVSTSAPLVRWAEAPTLAIAFWRTGLAVPVTGVVLAVRHRGELGSLDRVSRRRSLLAGVWLAGHFATWIPSLSFTSVASSVALVCTTPVWTALLDRRRGEVVPPAAWRGIGLALAGVVVLTGVDFAVTPRAVFGDVLALIGGALAAVYMSAGAVVRQVASTALYTTICYSAAAVVLLAICLVGRQPMGGYDGRTWLVLVAMTVGPQLLGHTLFNRVMRTTGATVVAVAVLGEIVGSALLAWVFFDEVPPITAIPAAALIAAGIVLVVRANRKPHLAVAKKRLRTPSGRGRLSWDGRLWDPAGREHTLDTDDLSRNEVGALLVDGEIQVAVSASSQGLRWLDVADHDTVWRDEIEPSFHDQPDWRPPGGAPGQLPFHAQLWRSAYGRVLLFTDHD